jgi:hypothetical protein
MVMSTDELKYQIHNPAADPKAISFFLEGKEVLKISPEGFWFRGELVPQDDREAQAVYNGLREFLVWAQLTRP